MNIITTTYIVVYTTEVLKEVFMGIKVVTIGGGSSYTPELIEGFIKRYEELPVRELWLVDIEEGREKLEIVGALARRMVEEAGVPMEIRLTLDRREALPGADFVTTQLRVGLLEARIKDERIPLSHRVLGQETNGAGGFFKGLRTIPVILEIIGDIEELCPDAWLINFTNPAGMVTEAVFRHTNFKRFIGLCNVPLGMHMGLSQLLGVDSERLRIDFAGLNHMVFGLNFYLDGREIKREAMEALQRPDAHISMANIMAEPWDPDFIKGLNVMPCPYLRYYWKHGDMLEKDLENFKNSGTRAEVVKGLERELFELYKNPELKAKPKQLEERGGAYYSDAACELISSIYNDRRDIQVVNTLNRGAVTNLPYDSVVEVSSVITKEGPRPLSVGALPEEVIGIVRQIKTFERLTADAAVGGDRIKALTALNLNPLIPSDRMGRIILEEMLLSHREYLPNFFKSSIKEEL